MKKIIIIDDDEIWISLYKRLLSKEFAEYEVISFSGGYDFVSYLKESGVVPEIVVTDMQMANGSGLYVINSLIEDEKYNHTGIICCSDYIVLKDKDWLSEWEVEIFIKSYKTEGIFSIIKKILKNPPQRHISNLKYSNAIKELQNMRLESQILRTKYIDHLIDPRVFDIMYREQEVDVVYEDVAVGFVDIRGFAEMANAMPVKQIGKYLEYYYEYVSRFIRDNDGYIDKYIGDSVMWIFNDSCGVDYQAKCLDVGKRILSGISDLETEINIALRKKIPVRLGIGIACGKALTGLFGTGMKYSNIHFTSMGPTVNIASRLCALAKNRELLIAGQFKNGLLKNEKIHESTGIRLKGFSQEVKVSKLKF